MDLLFFGIGEVKISFQKAVFQACRSDFYTTFLNNCDRPDTFQKMLVGVKQQHDRQTNTTVFNLEISPETECGQIHLNVVTV